MDDLIAGDVSGEEARTVRMHIASCSGCRAALSRSQLVEILPAMDDTIEPSGDFAARFNARLQSRPRPWWKNIAGWGWPRQLAAAGVLTVIIVAGVVVGRYRGAVEDRVQYLNEYGAAENLPLLKDMSVVRNLDLLEDFDAIENLPDLMKGKNEGRVR